MTKILNLKRTCFGTPHPPLPLKGGGLGRGRCRFICYGRISNLLEFIWDLEFWNWNFTFMIDVRGTR